MRINADLIELKHLRQMVGDLTAADVFDLSPWVPDGEPQLTIG